MSSLLRKPKSLPTEEIKTPDPLPPPAERSDTETQSLADAQRRRFTRGRLGRASTILTGGGGTEGGISAVRFLGGAART